MNTDTTQTPSELLIGFGSVDITPPEGLAMAGGLDPRWNEGTHTPLLVKTLLARCDGKGVAIVGVDLLGIPRDMCDVIIDTASGRTGLDPGSILICCSHTHSGPYIRQRVHLKEKVVDDAYVASLPDRITESIAQAVAAARPATMHLGRSLVFQAVHNRRVIVKHDGLAFNTWMRGHLNDLEAVPQVLGTAGPVDPELWVARFEALDGTCLGFLVNFSMHLCGKGGTLWSADYPAVIAEQLAEEFGPQAVSVFTAGACGNINPAFSVLGWDRGAELIAAEAVDAARRATKVDGPVPVAASRVEATVPRRATSNQREGAIQRLNWAGEGGRTDVFAPRIAQVAAMPEELTLPVSAARIGPLGIGTNPGELFVEWGIEMKRRSPFPHTMVVELTNDTAGYQPDEKAFELEGYETLIGSNSISLEGIQMLVDSAVEQLDALSAEERP